MTISLDQLSGEPPAGGPNPGLMPAWLRRAWDGPDNRLRRVLGGLALLALVLYPFVWLLLLPFRLLGIAVGGALELVSAIITLPVRVLRTI